MGVCPHEVKPFITVAIACFRWLTCKQQTMPFCTSSSVSLTPFCGKGTETIATAFLL